MKFAHFKTAQELTEFVNSNIEVIPVSISSSSTDAHLEYTLFYKGVFDEMLTGTPKNIVIINEQHILKSEQQSIIDEEFESYETVKIPANGLTLQQMKELCQKHKDNDVIMVSPIPFVIKQLQKRNSERYTEAYLGMNDAFEKPSGRVRVFHNDRRSKKELPNGKIIITPSEKGWVLA